MEDITKFSVISFPMITPATLNIFDDFFYGASKKDFMYDKVKDCIQWLILNLSIDIIKIFEDIFERILNEKRKVVV